MQVTLSNNQIVELQELTTGDIFDATDAAKTLQVIEKVGASFVVDHVMLERLLLLKSIKSINDGEVSANINWLRNLTPNDWEKLQNMNLDIDAATLTEVGERGRDSAAS